TIVSPHRVGGAGTCSFRQGLPRSDDARTTRGAACEGHLAADRGAVPMAASQSLRLAKTTRVWCALRAGGRLADRRSVDETAARHCCNAQAMADLDQSRRFERAS